MDITDKYAVRVRNSDTTAFSNLFDLLWEPMYTYACSVVADSAVAEDLVQEVWIDYWERRKETEIRNIRSYLYKAIRYRCYYALKNRRFDRTQVEAAYALTTPSEAVLEEDLTDLAGRVDAVLSTLPDRCREIFIMSRVNNMSNGEIAGILNISRRSVENQISFALRKFREDLALFILFLL
ncbi:sigma-70 family RNA polymerase sigma factor [Sinomicrobium soli]|uniref:sigma-70 family RNA polymerase sigma factor n=1 Tax=Sinomicrobium sp. N-1-3-6 TaxID=2219864 RepID=UPI000DCB304A|nr:sigma-70 family RNA polymerase sigma factor [Sinomicrobium sp. N-1-3-6]RAV30002.1 RNA polymerase sigma-70 factor [Sinomicrobium sp. N-1-3-6]